MAVWTRHLFGLEVRTSNTEEAQNKGETLQNEHVQCAKVDTSTLDRKTQKCVESADSEVRHRIKITCTAWTVRRTPWLRTSHRFKGVGEDVKADRSHEVRTRKRFSQAPGGDRGLLHLDKEALFEIQGHSPHTDHAPPVSRKRTWRGDGERS